MHFDPGAFVLATLIAGVGSALFIFGKRQVSLPHMLVGGIFVIYPYFISNNWLMIIIALLLSSILWLLTRMGW